MQEIFLFSRTYRHALGPTQVSTETESGPFLRWYNGRRVINSAKFKNVWNYTSTPPHAFMARGLSTGTTTPLYGCETWLSHIKGKNVD
jgi:hypothetical protein